MKYSETFGKQVPLCVQFSLDYQLMGSGRSRPTEGRQKNFYRPTLCEKFTDRFWQLFAIIVLQNY